MTKSSDTPVSAPVTTPPTEPTDENLMKLQFPRPLRFGTYINDIEHISHERPLTVVRPHNRAYELEATTPFKTVANGGFTAYQPGRASQRSSEKSCDLRKRQDDGTPSRLTARPKPVEDVGNTPATAIHHSKALDTTKKGRSTDKKNGSDPFLGTGKPLELFRSSNGAARRATTTELPSPSLTRLRSSQLGGTPGFLTLHDVHEEVLSLLDMLRAAHRDHTAKEVDAALQRCQEDLMARSKDKTIGTAEANILDREAARIGRARGETARRAPNTEDAAFQESLRLALARLIGDARAALDAAAQEKSQAASASREGKEYIPHLFEDDSRMTALNNENRTLKDQVDRFQADTSDLQKKLDGLTKELKAYRRDLPNPMEWGPWGKEWNTDSKRGG